jgi:hypothetical protein
LREQRLKEAREKEAAECTLHEPQPQPQPQPQP